jgi:hypothetical protein
MTKEYHFKSTRGNDQEYLIRRAIENQKHFVIEVYNEGKSFPAIISGRYSSLKKAKDAMGLHNTNGIIPWGNI